MPKNFSYLNNEYLDDPGPGLLVETLHVPSLTLLQGSIYEYLEEWKTNILFIILYYLILCFFYFSFYFLLLHKKSPPPPYPIS